MHPIASVKAGSLVKTKTPGIFKKNARYVVIFRDSSGRQRKRFARTMAEARDLKALLTADVRRGEIERCPRSRSRSTRANGSSSTGQD